ncbi:type I DNA topoisomerase [Thalassomonas haliotis]|uniref:Topoisomerase DNA-binding C4 zinc finger domain-containing protein n=1 Tax=Thalassomonas haliotis TaxID=485448 RepID=A0ABY7VGY8_9GAMM|nr:topoisomerase DNA-binding C4 zinc finger domain-containing protein [Thalassomonas haliotis]WDE11937.1 topoisomerase DNA-binding C4 zinc finger domain-containing protein [Thalassomonas haliotis]
MSNSDKSLFTLHEHALEKEHEVCPDCGGKLLIKNSKNGPFLGCSAYPDCQYTRPVVEHERIEDKVLAGSSCPECGHLLAVKQGRYGMFIGCTNFPDCQHIEETYHQDDVNIACPKCSSGELMEKTNRYGKTFYSCDQYPKCKYVLNYPPIAETCPLCQWPVLVKRKMASGEVIICPEKKCTYKRKAL